MRILGSVPKSKRSLTRLAAILTAVALLASACGSSDGESGAADGISSSDSGLGQLLPFSQVQDSDFTFEADVSDPNRGIFHVTTTEDMICTIVWGETEEFGHFNNSLAMNGTGIIQHDVFLPGAERGKTYFFRVQGSTADGNQFRSETGTFTISDVDSAEDDAMGGGATIEGMDDVDDMVVHGANLALESTIVEASSEFGPGWAASNAIDGETSTEWATKGDGDSGFITIDLGSPQSVVGTEFITRRMLDGTAITDTYTITIDGGDTLGPFNAGSPAEPNFNAGEFTGQVIRFDIDASSGGNVGAIEVNVFAPAGG